MPETPTRPVRVDEVISSGDADRQAVTYKSDTLTYAELADAVARVAAGLHDLGIRRGDRVLIYAEKRIETVVAMFAVAAAGAVFVPVNPQFMPRQIAYVLEDCAARAVISTVERLDALAEAMTTSVEHLVIMGDVVVAESLDLGPTVTAWQRLADTEPTPVPDGAAVIDADVAAILYTSGSTGGPKGVVLTHRNLLAGAESVAGYLGHRSTDVVLSVLPLSFDAGLSQITTALISGAHVVLVNYLTPREVMRLCETHKVTALTCVPPLWLQLAAVKWTPESTAHLRYFANTGGRMPRATLDRLRELFPTARPFLMYGLTEAFRSTYLDPAEVDRRPDSIGKAIPNAEVLVVRPDGTPCAPGEHGELVHRGALVSLGYWNDPQRTAERFRPLPGPAGVTRPELAVWSGDVAYRDDEGFLYFVGRDDEMIKTSGYRVSPTEVEEAAYSTALVSEAVAFGVPDDKLGQLIVLMVRPTGADLSAEELVKAMAQELPRYMLPKRVEILDELPRSVNGKFDRVLLRRKATS